MARDPRRKGQPKRTPELEVFRDAVYRETIDEAVRDLPAWMHEKVRAAKASCWHAGRTGPMLHFATGIHEHGDPCLFCGRPGEEVEAWFPEADWLDRLGCPAGHQGVVMLLVCKPCCAIHPPPHADLPAGANSTREAVLRASRTPGPFLARWMTEDPMRRYIARPKP